MTAVIIFECIFVLPLIIFLIWYFIADEITYRQRLKILQHVSNLSKTAIEARQDWIHFYEIYARTSYYQHLHAVLLFRDPSLLYLQEIRP